MLTRHQKKKNSGNNEPRSFEIHYKRRDSFINNFQYTSAPYHCPCPTNQIQLREKLKTRRHTGQYVTIGQDTHLVDTTTTLEIETESHMCRIFDRQHLKSGERQCF